MFFPRISSPCAAILRLRLFASLITVFLLVPFSVKAGDGDWKPLAPEHLALKKPIVEPQADAEALFWEVRVDDSSAQDLVLSHYIRTKIFTERGRESQGKVEIPYGKIGRLNIRIKDIAARTIKPDGTIVELKDGDVFERTQIKTSGLRVKVKSFALPGVEPGSIIEYRWREVRANTSFRYMPLQFQRDIPVQRVSYLVKPFTGSYTPYSMRYIPFRTSDTKFTKDKSGFYRAEMTNVAAFREEPHMPPESSVRSWMLLYYTEEHRLTPDKYWADYAKRMYEATKPMMKVNDDVRRASAEAIGDATDDETKLRRLFDFCRTRIKNASDDAAGLTPDERAKLKENKTPADTLKRGIGTAQDIDLLFAALASAAGYEARIASLVDRSQMFFDPQIADEYFMNPANVAVRVGSDWRFFNPGSRHVPFGMLLWGEEGVNALISDSKEALFVKTPISPANKSTERRTAQLRLTEDGTLEGNVRVEYTGHRAIERREYEDEDAPADREEALRTQIKTRLSTAEISDIKIENLEDTAKPLVYAYRVRVPGYAQRTGKRLFLQPAFFQFNGGALFPISERQHAVYFSYPWSEKDHVEIELPDGFALDNADSPQPFTAGAISKYNVKLGVTKDKKTLVYDRAFDFGGNDTVLFPRESYPQLKRYFDVVHEQDKHSVALKTTAPTAAQAQ